MLSVAINLARTAVRFLRVTLFWTSAALALTWTTLGFKSLWIEDSIRLGFPRQTWYLRSDAGLVELDWNTYNSPVTIRPYTFDWHARTSDNPAFATGARFYWKRFWADTWQEYGGQITRRRLAFPHWAAALLFAAWPTIAATRKLRHRPPPPDLCPTCQYDLRATAHQCPECGTRIPVRTSI
jgi:hypothetical protein